MRNPKLDRVIIEAIAVSQLLLSLLSVLLGMSYVGGPLFLLFGIWGFITALVLDTSSIRARKNAIVWHIIFVALVAYAFTVSNPPHYTQAQWILLLWAAAGLAVICYLASGLDNLESENK